MLADGLLVTPDEVGRSQELHARTFYTVLPVMVEQRWRPFQDLQLYLRHATSVHSTAFAVVVFAIVGASVVCCVALAFSIRRALVRVTLKGDVVPGGLYVGDDLGVSDWVHDDGKSVFGPNRMWKLDLTGRHTRSAACGVDNMCLKDQP
jgi:hypothetical protein